MSLEEFERRVRMGREAQERIDKIVGELWEVATIWRNFTCTQCGGTVQVSSKIAIDGKVVDVEAWCTGGKRPHRKVRMVEVDEEE